MFWSLILTVITMIGSVIAYLDRRKRKNGVKPVSDKSVNLNVTQIVNSDSKDFKNAKESKFHGLDTYDSDLPPLIDIWVGRGPELSLLEEMKNGVIAITGIGGQGKSALAAKTLEIYRKNNKYAFWDWRDCREQANRFRTQLLSVVEHFSKGEVKADTLNDAEVDWLSKYFFRKVRDVKGFLVFDNVDHYVDVESSRFTSDVSAFVQESLRVKHNFLIIFTCRPRISYPSVRFREIFLRGLELNETMDLFQKKLSGGFKNSQKEIIRKFHNITNGHPLWLNIIASQVGRKPESASIILRILWLETSMILQMLCFEVFRQA